jgi:formylmethanofuran dehydrogenase subunit C
MDMGDMMISRAIIDKRQLGQFFHPSDSEGRSKKGRFSRYKIEPEKSMRKPDIVQPGWQQIADAWHAYCQDSLWTDSGFPDPFDFNKRCTLALRWAESIPAYYSPDDVEDFSLALGYDSGPGRSFQLRAGLFLSALVNKGRDERYVIHTAHLPPLERIGHRNTKNLEVVGDCGEMAGSCMEGGILHVRGNVAKNAGYRMVGGELRIDGDADTNLGLTMKGGEILLKGDFRQGKKQLSVGAGSSMEGGRITIMGSAKGTVGDFMEDGVIDVKGSSRSVGKGMKGGLVIIGSSASYSIGSWMKGGRIEIRGEARGRIGHKMRGGEIHVAGKCDRNRIGRVIGGAIFIGDELVVER